MQGMNPYPQEKPLALSIEQALHGQPPTVAELIKSQGWITSADSTAGALMEQNLALFRADLPIQECPGMVLLQRIEDMKKAIFIDTGDYPSYIRISAEALALFQRTPTFALVCRYKVTDDAVNTLMGLPYVLMGELADKTFQLLGRRAITIE